MVIIKEGVIFRTLRPEVRRIIDIGEIIFDLLGVDLVITSANDGKHSPESLHYSGLALDMRIKHIGKVEDKKRAATFLTLALGDDYDVVLESLGKPNEHIHVEYDPPRRKMG